MSRLVKIAGWHGAPRASVIFVHGLGGDAYDTWRRKPDNDTFWPLWLANDVQGISVYTLAYEAPPSNWLGTSMPLQDRAVNVLEILLSEPGLGIGPIIFVSHSLGGLIVKQILLDMQQQEKRRPEAKDLFERVTQVVFAATPHTGSRQGTLLDRLRFFAWPSSIARTLVANDPALRSINVAYRGLADERRNVLKHRIFFETQDTPAGGIVDEASSDPGLPGDPPVPVDANHVSIVKPFDRSSILYARTRDFIAKSHPDAETQEGRLEIYPLPPIRSEQSSNIVPKLIRIAAIGLVVLIGYKGVQALIAPAAIGPSKEQIEQIQKPLSEQLATKDAQISALTQMLLEKNPAAGPGAQQAVGTAVESIAQGAAEGDSRLQQALALLKENKVGEATQLLSSIAQEKTASAEQAATQAGKDRKEAATAYRNLGAIAALRDPKKALEAYAKAVELNPDDKETLYWHGWLSLLAGQLPVAEQSLDRLLKIAAATSDQRGIYRANLRLGELAKERGNVVVGLEYEEKAKDIAIEQAAYPSEREWQRDLAVAYEKIGDLQKAQGDLAEALKFYNDDLTIAERLAKLDPRDARGQRDLSICYEEIGDVQMAQSDLKGALKSYKDSLSIRERLAQFDPASPGWQSDLSFTYIRLGDVQRTQGDLQAALKSYQNGLAIRENLAKSDSGNAGWQRDLSVAYDNIGDVQVAHGDLSGALKSYQDGLAIAERLVTSDPGNAEWQRDLSVSYNKVGGVQEAQGDLAGALPSFQDSLAIRERLAKSDPGNAEWQRDLSVSYDKIGNLQMVQGDLKAALKSYSGSLAIRARLAKSNPSNAGWQRDLSVSYAKLASLHQRSGDKKKTLAALRQGQAIMARLTKLSPDNDGWKKNLTWFEGQIKELSP
jgi:tetratricopeptide (TPR) repeat protein/pimeloyl-ACP methyl ester carboxylesterase